MTFNANAFSLDAHKELAKKQALESVTSDKSTSEMVDEHKELLTSEVEETVSEKTDTTTDKVEEVTATVDSIKGLFN